MKIQQVPIYAAGKAPYGVKPGRSRVGKPGALDGLFGVQNLLDLFMVQNDLARAAGRPVSLFGTKTGLLHTGGHHGDGLLTNRSPENGQVSDPDTDPVAGGSMKLAALPVTNPGIDTVLKSHHTKSDRSADLRDVAIRDAKAALPLHPDIISGKKPISRLTALSVEASGEGKEVGRYCWGVEIAGGTSGKGHVPAKEVPVDVLAKGVPVKDVPVKEIPVGVPVKDAPAYSKNDGRPGIYPVDPGNGTYVVKNKPVFSGERKDGITSKAGRYAVTRPRPVTGRTQDLQVPLEPGDAGKETDGKRLAGAGRRMHPAAPGRTVVDDRILDGFMPVGEVRPRLSRSAGAADRIDPVTTDGLPGLREFTIDRSVSVQTPDAGMTPQLRKAILSEIEKNIVERLERAAGGGVREDEMRLRLYPPELGEVRIKVLIEGQRIRASFVVESMLVKHVVDEGAARLYEAMSHEGFTLDHLDVSIDDAGGHDAYNEPFEENVPYIQSDIDHGNRQTIARPAMEGAGINLLA